MPIRSAEIRGLGNNPSAVIVLSALERRGQAPILGLKINYLLLATGASINSPASFRNTSSVFKIYPTSHSRERFVMDLNFSPVKKAIPSKNQRRRKCTAAKSLSSTLFLLHIFRTVVPCS
jgi:hypothetical protein